MSSRMISFLACASVLSVGEAFSSGNDAPFSLSAYQKARARETSAHLDASRFHFQILFVDDDNFHGRIAEGILAQLAEYNDAMCTLFPYSATIESMPNAPRDSAAPKEAMEVCDLFDLNTATCSEDGTSFNLSYLDQYDLIIAFDDEIQSLILRSLPPGSEGYEQKCRSLSEFMSIDFCGIQNKKGVTEKQMRDMIEPNSWDRVMPYYDAAIASRGTIFSGSKASDVYQPRMILSDDGAAIPNPTGWPVVEAAMFVACSGIVRFCLDTMDAQFDEAFSTLLDNHFKRPEHLDFSIEQADDQLRLGSLSITGYFSQEERHARISNHFEKLRSELL